jgi:hypothetical protein
LAVLPPLPEPVHTRFDWAFVERLDITGNKLTELPAVLFERLCNLKVVLADHNHLTDLSERVSLVRRTLKVLTLHHNELAALPSQLVSIALGDCCGRKPILSSHRSRQAATLWNGSHCMPMRTCPRHLTR